MELRSGWEKEPTTKGTWSARESGADQALDESARGEAADGDGELLDRIVAVELAATVGHSMGDVTEIMDWTEIEEQYGLVTTMLPQPRKWADKKPNLPTVRGYPSVYQVHDRPPGMSEDGHERHRLTATAVIEKRGRVTVEDVARIWVRDIDPEKFGILLGAQDQVIYYSAKAGVPPWDIGKFAYFPGAWGVTAMMAPIGVVNAGSPASAARDALDVGRLKDQSGVNGNYALEVASAVAAGIAEGLGVGSSVTSVIDAALAQLSPVPRTEVEHILEWLPEGGDWRGLRDLLDQEYKGRTILWPVETLGTALATVNACEGVASEAIIASVNLGRDTDGRACVAGALSAAISGTAGLDPEWEGVIAEQVVEDPYTVSRRTPRETGEGLFSAVQQNLADMRGQLDRVPL